MVRDRSGRQGGGAVEVPSGDRAAGYGSVIRKGDSRHREEYHRVREVLDVRTVELEDGTSLRLLGLLESEKGAGSDRLRELVSGKQVYFKSDPRTGEEGGVYLYLRNRTCINSRLIRDGAAEVDESREYRMKKRFLRYRDEVEA